MAVCQMIFIKHLFLEINLPNVKIIFIPLFLPHNCIYEKMILPFVLGCLSFGRLSPWSTFLPLVTIRFEKKSPREIKALSFLSSQSETLIYGKEL